MERRNAWLSCTEAEEKELEQVAKAVSYTHLRAHET